MFKEFDTKFSIIIIVLVNIFYLLGYYDDLKDLSPKKKTFIIVVILFLSIPFDENIVLKSLIFKDLINTQIYLNNFSILLESVQCESDSNSEIITRTDLFL